MGRNNNYSPEVQERAVRLVLQSINAHESRWAAIVSVAGKMGCHPQTLNKWVRRAEASGQLPAGTPSQGERMAALEQEVRELRRANEILRKASAFFAQAELDRRPR